MGLLLGGIFVDFGDGAVNDATGGTLAGMTHGAIYVVHIHAVHICTHIHEGRVKLAQKLILLLLHICYAGVDTVETGEEPDDAHNSIEHTPAYKPPE